MKCVTLSVCPVLLAETCLSLSFLHSSELDSISVTKFYQCRIREYPFCSILYRILPQGLKMRRTV